MEGGFKPGRIFPKFRQENTAAVTLSPIIGANSVDKKIGGIPSSHRTFKGAICLRPSSTSARVNSSTTILFISSVTTLEE